MRLAFVVADARSQQPTYSTAYIALAALRRGHDVAFVGADDLTLAPDNTVRATLRRPGPGATTTTALCAALATAPDSDEPLGGFDVVFLRHNPHHDGHGAPIAELGAHLRDRGTLVVNDPEGTQRAGGRMYLTGLPAEIRPRTLITRDAAEVKAFLRTLDAPALIKPLTDRSGAAPRFTVARGQVKNLNQMISAVRKGGYLVVQEYVTDDAGGEKRLLLLGGEPLRDGRRTAIYRRAAEDSLPGDDAATPGRRRADLGPAEQRIVDLLRPRLAADGLYFVSVDIAGDKVLEVNVHTPGGAHTCAELYGLDVGDVIVRDLMRRAGA